MTFAPRLPAARRVRTVRSFALAVALAATTLATAAPAHPLLAAGLEPAVEARLDHLFTEAYPADGPGATVIVTREGTPLYRKAYGMADLELGVPMQPDNVLRIGSITKQFTAVLVMMMVEEGKLSLDDPLVEHFPDYPAAQAEGVTVHHLLTHTSGLKSYTGMEEWGERWRDDFTPEEMIAFFRDQPRDFAPGESFAYNNSAYFLLGAILEQVSGKSYAELVTERIFEPLGMNSSSYGDPERIVPRRAEGYAGGPGAWRNAPYLSMTQPYAAGSLLSTVDDLARWDRALSTGELLSAASRERLVTPATLASGESIGYGYGWGLWEYAGHRVIEHSGGIHGYLSDAVRVPDAGLYVAALSNNPTRPPGDLVHQTMGILLGHPLDARPAVELPSTTLEEYVGVYQIGDDPEDVRIVRVEDGKLTTQRRGGEMLAPRFSARDEIYYADDAATRIAFVRDEAGRVTGMRAARSMGPAEVAVKTDRPVPAARQAADPASLPPGLYDEMVGEYAMGASATLAIRREGDRLVAQVTGQPPIELQPESADRFFTVGVDAVLLVQRDGSGRIEALELHQSGRVIPLPRRD